MSFTKKNLSDYKPEDLPSAEGLSFGIVVSEWNEEVTFALLRGCIETLEAQGAKAEDIHTVQVPGAYELPMGARLIMGAHKLDAVICLGCVIKGETSHNEYINQSVAMALQQLGLSTGRPCIFGLLTPNSPEQALDRAGGKHGNKGVEAATTAIRMAALRRDLKEGEGKAKIGFGF